ncbi:MAG: Rieske (2Fe-2S) protein, partial [Nitrososphaeraceae archaeon]
MKKIAGYSRKNGNTHDNINHNLRYLCRTTDIIPNRSRSFSIRNEDVKDFEIAVFNVEGKYYAISNTCKHAGGPLSQGLLKGKVVICPWHGWKYSIVNGKSPHKGGDSVDSYEAKVVDGKLYVNLVPTTLGKRVTEPHKAYTNLKNSVYSFLNHIDKDAQLITGVDRKRNVLGISTTNLNDEIAPRKSTSEQALIYALDYAKNELDSNTLMIKLRDLSFKHCEGYYSKNAKACIFPCSISEMDKDDQ